MSMFSVMTMNLYSTDTLFYSVHKSRHSRMTEDNVRKIVKEYGNKARAKEPSIPENVHPRGHLARQER